MKPKDTTDALMKEQFQILAENSMSASRREIHRARQQLKHFIHKHDRHIGKQQVVEQLSTQDED